MINRFWNLVAAEAIYSSERSPLERPDVVSGIAINRDAPDAGIRLSGFRHLDCQDAILERGRDFVFIDIFQRYTPFKAAVIPFAETTVLVLPIPIFSRRRSTARHLRFPS